MTLSEWEKGEFAYISVVDATPVSRLSLEEKAFIPEAVSDKGL